MTEHNEAIAIITGGGTGIGRATAKKYLQNGGRVVLNGRRAEVLQATAQELDPSGERVATVAGSISDPSTSDSLIETALERFGRVDVLVNNAGVFRPMPFVEHTPDDLRWFVETILYGTFYASQAAAKVMTAAGSGSIVNVGSIWAEQAVGATPSSAYSAAKAGVHALTRNLAIELAPHGVRVNAVAPAVVQTPVYETFIPKEEVPEVLAGFDSFHPIGRTGTAEEVAELIYWLGSGQAGWVTGTTVPVDGGVLAGRV